MVFKKLAMILKPKQPSNLLALPQMVRMPILATKVGFGLGYKKYVKRSCSFTYWCTAHHSNLAFKSARNQVAELNILLNDLQSVATFF